MKKKQDPYELKTVYMDSPGRRVLNLEAAGCPGIPVLGMTRQRSQVISVRAHTHTEVLEIGLCLRGRLFISGTVGDFEIMPGQIFVNLPGVLHHLTAQPRGLFIYWMLIRIPENPARQHLLGLPKEDVMLLRRRLLALPPVLTSDRNALRTCFLALLQQYDAPEKEERSLLLRHSALALLLCLLDCPMERRPLPNTERLKMLICRMKESPEKEFHVDDLARSVALSTTSFINRFKMITGLPPIHYLIECRIEAAKRLLHDSTLTVTQIAMRLGFSSSQHFSSQFRTVTGETPKAWRINHREDD